MHLDFWIVRTNITHHKTIPATFQSARCVPLASLIRITLITQLISKTNFYLNCSLEDLREMGKVRQAFIIFADRN